VRLGELQTVCSAGTIRLVGWVLGALTVNGKGKRTIREDILDAAMNLAIRDGVMAVTLDGVCKQVGISKGGLIHYYKNKDELLVGMMERFVGHFEQHLQGLVAKDKRPKHRHIRAMLETAKTMIDGKKKIEGLPVPAGHATQLMMSLLTASANNPVLLGTIRRKFESMRAAMLEDSAPDGHLALVLWMAFDGLMLWKHLGLITGDDKLNEQLIRRMQFLLENSDNDTNQMRRSAKGKPLMSKSRGRK
jgi:AcrR family transcriptional regulator